jgi:hypothetical protein
VEAATVEGTIERGSSHIQFLFLFFFSRVCGRLPFSSLQQTLRCFRCACSSWWCWLPSARCVERWTPPTSFRCLSARASARRRQTPAPSGTTTLHTRYGTIQLRCCKCPPGTWMPSRAHDPHWSGSYATMSGITDVSLRTNNLMGVGGAYIYPYWGEPRTLMPTEYQLIPCLKCPPGTASSTRGATSDQTCQLCPSGFFTAHSGSDTCAPCPPGSWSTPGSSSCFNVSTLPAVDVPSNCSLRDFPSSEVVGDVLDSIDATSESACRASCCDLAPCQGYTFFKPLLSIPRCTLLGSNITYVVPSNQFVSAVRSGVLGY